jgi:hypothetical protein
MGHVTARKVGTAGGVLLGGRTGRDLRMILRASGAAETLGLAPICSVSAARVSAFAKPRLPTNGLLVKHFP